MERFLFALLRASLLSFAFANVVVTLYHNRDRLSFAYEVFSSIDGRVLFDALMAIFGVATGALLLMNLHDVFRTGWTSLFFERAGNILLMPFLNLNISDLTLFNATNIVAFFVLLGMALPFFSHYEERLFRSKLTTYRSIMGYGILFGFAHLIIGIPIAAAIAISGFGIYLGCEYKWAFDAFRKTRSRNEAHESALFVTTVKHTAYNAVLLGTVCVLSSLYALAFFYF